MTSNIRLYISRYMFRRKYRLAIQYLNLACRIRQRAESRDRTAAAYEQFGVPDVASKHRRAANLLRAEAQLVQNLAKQLVPNGKLVTVKNKVTGVDRPEQSQVPSPSSAAEAPFRRKETVDDFAVKHKRSAVRIFGEDGNAPSFGFRSLIPKKDADHRLSFTFDQINDIPGLMSGLAAYGLEHLQLDAHSRDQCQAFLDGYASYRRHWDAAKARQSQAELTASEGDPHPNASKEGPVDTINGSAR